MTDGILCIIPVDPMERYAPMRDIPYTPSLGMVPTPCEKCGIKGWLGPKQAAKKVQCPEMEIVCTNCMVDMAQAARSTNIFGPVRMVDES